MSEKLKIIQPHVSNKEGHIFYKFSSGSKEYYIEVPYWGELYQAADTLKIVFGIDVNSYEDFRPVVWKVEVVEEEFAPQPDNRSIFRAESSWCEYA